jgi:hypothetical protein
MSDLAALPVQGCRLVNPVVTMSAAMDRFLFDLLCAKFSAWLLGVLIPPSPV